MMRILIIEDEEFAANRLSELLKMAMPGCTIAGITTGVIESIAWLGQQQADLIFSDIQLTDGLSFSIFEKVQTDSPIIFTTAFDQYAIKAFQTNGIAYLLKPVRFEDVKASLLKFDRLKGLGKLDFEALVKQLQVAAPGYKQRFLIHYANKIKSLEVQDIAYAYIDNGQVYFQSFAGVKYPTEHSLDKLEEWLDPGIFFRINRKMMVGFKAIQTMVPWSRSRIKVVLSPTHSNLDEQVVSVERAASFKEWLNR
jgi:DNA-binding LytR/AlgR family response regulator